MTRDEFIFSNKPKPRVARHLAFWATYYFRFVALYLPDAKLNTLINPDIYLSAWHEALFFLPVYLFSVYITIYFILPRYLANKNTVFLVLSWLLLVIVALSAGYFISSKIYGTTDQVSLAACKCLSGFIAITSCAVLIKIMKDYFFRQQEYEMLAAKNIVSKVQLLKMQIHPNILFESLNNICDDIDSGMSHAPGMILNLSELLSYLLYEGEMKQVPLTREVKMLQTYIELKKSGYKSKLKIDFEVSGEIGSFFIIPVLFLPLLEASIIPVEKIETDLFIRTEIKVASGKLYFKSENNLPCVQIKKTTSVQTTLDSLKYRLRTSRLYKFKLESKNDLNNWTITLQLEPAEHVETDNIRYDSLLTYEHT